MKKAVYVVMVAVSMALFAGCGNANQSKTSTQQTSAEKVVYTCPMHPEVTSDKPGNCPKCGMKLVEKKEAKHDSMHKMSTDSMKNM
jgi:hypothetical protein